jgi:hypothetical protein
MCFWQLYWWCDPHEGNVEDRPRTNIFRLRKGRDPRIPQLHVSRPVADVPFDTIGCLNFVDHVTCMDGACSFRKYYQVS